MALFIALLSTFKKLRLGLTAFDIQDVRKVLTIDCRLSS